MAHYDRHRALSEARTIEFQGEVFETHPAFVAQLLLSHIRLKPDGPFPAETDVVDVMVGNRMMSLRIGEVEQLIRLACDASVRETQFLNGLRAKPEGAL